MFDTFVLVKKCKHLIGIEKCSCIKLTIEVRLKYLIRMKENSSIKLKLNSCAEFIIEAKLK